MTDLSAFRPICWWIFQFKFFIENHI